MNYMTKKLPENSKVSVSIVRATMMEGTYKNNTMKCNLLVPFDILNIEL